MGAAVKKRWLLVFAAVAGASGSAAFAQNGPDPGARAGFLLQSDLELGGDRVATVDFDDGDTQDVRAGQGVSLAIGAYVRPSNTPLEISGTVGFKYVTTAADNADIYLSRTVLKLNATYWLPQDWFISAGLTQHLSPSLHGDGFFENVDFEDATGYSLEAGWRWFALRYTNIEYSLPGFEDTDASSIGLSVTWRFGGKRGGY